MTAVGMTVSLCVLLWAHPGQEDALIDYETRVLDLVPDHAGRVLHRVRTDGANEQPLEIQLLEFESQAAIDAYLADARRLALAELRDRAVARTEVMRVSPAPPAATARTSPR